MARREVFITLVVLLFGGLLLWFVFLYQPQKLEAEQLENQLKAVRNKLKNANRANLDIQNVETKLLEEQKGLETIKTRFIEKAELAKVSEKMREVSKQYKLKMTDFAPVLENYFADTISAKISDLPLMITVQGKYLDVGQFIENWKNLPFYITPEEISITRIKSQSNDLETKIMCKIYAWNH